jgi:hypothetical protein
MRRDFSQPLLQLDGQPFADQATLGMVCENLLLNINEQGVAGDEKLARFNLAKRIHGRGVQDVTAEDVTLLKRMIGTYCPPNVVGPAYEALEQDYPEQA